MSYLISQEELESEKTWKYQQSLKVAWRKSPVLSLSSRCNNLAIAANSSQEPWIKHSTGDKSCYTLIHTLPQTLRECICKSTECDATSKVGTKAAALKANLHLPAVLEQVRRPNFLAPKEAERYHSSALYSKENCNTFDDLQYILYTKMNKTL